MPTRDDLFVIECLKEVAWPYGHQPETESLLQDSAGRLFRVVTNTAEAPFACAHEFVAEHLARALGLGVPPGERQRFGHRDLYAQRFDPAWQPWSPARFAAQPEAGAAASAILGFDLWLGNRARHAGALVGEILAPEATAATSGANATAPLPTHWLLIRHQAVFIGLYGEDDEGGAFEPIPPEPAQIAGGHPLVGLVRGHWDFDPFLKRVEGLEAETVRDVLRLVPGSWLTPAQKAVVHDYLVARAGLLRGLVGQLRPLCPEWT